MANAVASYLNLWASWGISPTPTLRAWVERQIRAGVGSSQILALFRKTKAYARRFPGIFRKDGSMRMTEAQYVAGYNAANDFAASIGRNLSPAAYGVAVKNGNSPSEIKDKLQALDTMKSNRDIFREFGDYLLTRGIVKKPLKQKDLYAFIMKAGPRAWEQEWETAYASSQLARAEIDVGRPKEGGDISYRGLDKLVEQAKAFGTLPAPGDWRALATMVAEVIPLSALYKEGISKKNLAELYYGGKKAPEIEARVTRLLATHQAFATEQRAAPQLVQGPRGSQLRTGQVPQQATE